MKSHLAVPVAAFLLILGLGVIIAAAGTTEILPAIGQVSFGAACLFLGNKILSE